MSGEQGKYIYCIIKADGDKSFGNIGMGESNEEVKTIIFEELAAVVSSSPVKKYRVSRNNMMTHEKVIEKVMENYSVLPVKFGTVAENTAKIKKILEEHYIEFGDLLVDMNDKKEMGLKALFYEDKIFKLILEKNNNISDLRDAIAKKPPEKTHHQRARIGEMVQNALENEKEDLNRKILQILTPLSVKDIENKNYGDKMIINAAFLIKKETEPLFDEAVNKLDELYGEIVKFKYITKIPPFNFVNLEVNV